MKGLWLIAIIALLAMNQRAYAHSGPPFPIMQDQRIGPVVVSVWSNPDVGTGSFFILVDPPPGGSIPSDLKVQIGIQPVTGRLKEVVYGAWLEKLRGQVEYKTVVQFDSQELWRVRVILASSQGSAEATTNVQVTPPGFGRWDLLLFLLPFLGVGALWFKAATRKRGRRKMPSPKG